MHMQCQSAIMVIIYFNGVKVQDRSAENCCRMSQKRRLQFESNPAVVFFQQVQDLFAQAIIFFFQLTNTGFQHLDLFSC